MAKVAGLSEELRALDAELRSLGGGGDAAIAPAAVYYSVCPAPVRSATVGGAIGTRTEEEGGEPVPAVALLPGGDGVAVIDPSDDTSRAPAVQDDRRVRLERSGRARSRRVRLAHAGLRRAGGDARTIGHPGKSHVTFGGGGMGVHPVAHRQLRQTRRHHQALPPGVHAGGEGGGGVETRGRRRDTRGEATESIADEVRHRFGVSCWEMSPDGRVVDLLDPTGDAQGLAGVQRRLAAGAAISRAAAAGIEDRGTSSFECVSSVRRGGVHRGGGRGGPRAQPTNVRELDAAAPMRSTGLVTVPVTVDRDGAGTVGGRRGSRAIEQVARVRAPDGGEEPEGVVSECHVCDLVGARALGLAELHDRSSDGSSVEGDRDRRGAARQLLAFSQVVDEKLQTGAQEDGPDSSEGAPGSPSPREPCAGAGVWLTQTLAPLMGVGARTFMLCTVSPLPDDHLDTLNTLRVAQRCARIDAACVRVSLPRNTGRALRSRFTTLREAVARADAVADAALVSAANAGVVSTTEAFAGGGEGVGGDAATATCWRRRRRLGSAGCWRRLGSAGCSRAPPEPDQGCEDTRGPDARSHASEDATVEPHAGIHGGRARVVSTCAADESFRLAADGR